MVTLEKEEHSVSTKFDYWNNAIQRDPEIDTHMVDNGVDDKENAISTMINPNGIQALPNSARPKLQFKTI